MKKIDVPPALFDDDEGTSAVRLSPLERYLGRERDKDGTLVPRKKKAKTIAASTFEHTRIVTQEMMDAKDWRECKARHLVALYDLMHRKVYRIEATLSGTERYTATLRAGAFIKNAFGGDFERAIDYFRWVWTREREREKYRRENNRDGGHVGIWFMFGNRLLDEYRLALARQRR